MPDQTKTTPTAPNVREVLDAARMSIRTALKDHDLEAAKQTHDELRGLTVHYLVHSGGPAYDVALVAEEARAAVDMIVAVRAIERTQASVGPV